MLMFVLLLLFDGTAWGLTACEWIVFSAAASVWIKFLWLPFVYCAAAPVWFKVEWFSTVSVFAAACEWIVYSAAASGWF